MAARLFECLGRAGINIKLISTSEIKIAVIIDGADVDRAAQITHQEFGLLKLFLVSRGRKLAIAGFLGPEEKESFANALGNAIGEAKRGPTRNP